MVETGAELVLDVEVEVVESRDEEGDEGGDEDGAAQWIVKCRSMRKVVSL